MASVLATVYKITLSYRVSRFGTQLDLREALSYSCTHHISPMHRIRHEDLPHRGSSHRFVGAEQGDTGISVFLFNGQPGSGPGPHRHPYDEVQFIQAGRGLYTVEGEAFEAGAGDILVIKAGEVHSFKCIGDSPLVQMDVHLSPEFIQENLDQENP